MHIENRIKAFVRLGNFLDRFCGEENKNPEPLIKEETYEEFEAVIKNAYAHNKWFTEENIRLALGSIRRMLKEDELRKWVGNYKELLKEDEPLKKVGVIMAGNIPLVGFHDQLCVLLSGNILYAKPSSDDRLLPLKLAEVLIQIEPEFKERIKFVNKIENPDAIIATGSNNSALHFEYYFGRYPHIIRKNRNSAAVLTGNETPVELENLGKDIFRYFGLGCRNVSKIFIPKGYDLDKLFNALYSYRDIVNHNKYGNNYDYNKTVYLLGGEQIIENGFLLLKQDRSFSSPVAVLFYEYYSGPEELKTRLSEEAEKIQCIVGNNEFANVKFGDTQCPGLSDYADKVDTMKFLLNLKGQ